MNTALFRVQRRRVSWRRPPVAVKKREWLDLAGPAILYFGVTLAPLLVVVVLYECGVIALEGPSSFTAIGVEHAPARPGPPPGAAIRAAC